MLSQQYGGGKWRASIPKIPSTVNIPRYEILTASNTDTSTTTTQVTRPATITQTDTLPTTTSAEKLAESEMEKEAATSSNLQVCNQVCLRRGRTGYCVLLLGVFPTRLQWDSQLSDCLLVTIILAVLSQLCLPIHSATFYYFRRKVLMVLSVAPLKYYYCRCKRWSPMKKSLPG